MKVRPALSSELTQVYDMGFDVWSGGKPLDQYRVACAESPKYKRGTWYVLEGEAGKLCASLITYELEPAVFGVGSIATAVDRRRQGFASSLTSVVVNLLEAEGAALTYLWSDIGASFYERLGFVPLPEKDQPDPDSVCMVKRSEVIPAGKTMQTIRPGYF